MTIVPDNEYIQKKRRIIRKNDPLINNNSSEEKPNEEVNQKCKFKFVCFRHM
jgi:hypothetical protein